MMRLHNNLQYLQLTPPKNLMEERSNYIALSALQADDKEQSLTFIWTSFFRRLVSKRILQPTFVLLSTWDLSIVSMLL